MSKIKKSFLTQNIVRQNSATGIISALSPTQHSKHLEHPGELEIRQARKFGNQTLAKWKEWLREQDDKSLEDVAEEIMKKAIEVLEDKENPDMKDALKILLEGKPIDPEDSWSAKIDDCVRWTVLLKAVDISSRNKPHVEAVVTLSKMIVEQQPYLAFENPADPPSKEIYARQCQNKKEGEETTEQEQAGMEKTLRMKDQKQQKGAKTSINKKRHDSKEKNRPFHIAAMCGNYEVIAAMIFYGKAFYSRNELHEDYTSAHRPEFFDSDVGSYILMSQIVQRREPKWTQATREDGALTLAVNCFWDDKNRSLMTIKELLEIWDLSRKEDLESSNKSFESAIQTGWIPIVEAFLGAGAIVTDDHIVNALKTLESIETSESGKFVEIVKTLIHAWAKRSDASSPDIMEKIVMADVDDVWTSETQKLLAKKVRASHLLCLAVKHGKDGLVKELLKTFPETVREAQDVPHGETETDEKRYPLWYNNHIEEGKTSKSRGNKLDKVRQSIRDDLVNIMIQVEPSVRVLSHMLSSCNESAGELCFDMSGINSASYKVSEVVKSLIRQSTGQTPLVYEKTLRYAEFPSLDRLVEERETYTDSEYLQRKHQEVFDILEWLHDKGVKRILKLKVPDRLVNPHDDLKMAKYVDTLKVETLDWMMPDLSISVLTAGTKERLKELHLYSSGNRAVIDHWFSKGGLLSLTNLATLKISIIQETCTLDRFRAVRPLIQGKINKFNELHPRRMSNQVGLTSWYPKATLADLVEIAERIAPDLALRLKRISTTIADKNRTPDKHRPTKVAILDNGILSISPVPLHVEENAVKERGNMSENIPPNHDEPTATQETDDSRILWKRIKEGRSFVDTESKQRPWHFASDPHGTQMANLICAIDPFCELYVARIAENRTGIDAESVAQAIKWARSREVDIISMSFIIEKDPDKKVPKEIDRASAEGILMTCSAHDEGLRISSTLPISKSGDSERSLIVLAACDEFGSILRKADGLSPDYLIQGQNIAAGVVPFLKSEDTVTGSSVATAIAAGLSSLVLTCDRLSDSKKTYGGRRTPSSRYKLVTDKLTSMAIPNVDFIPSERFHNILSSVPAEM